MLRSLGVFVLRRILRQNLFHFHRFCIPWTHAHHKLARWHEQHLYATCFVLDSPRQLCFSDAVEKICIGDNLGIRILLENFSPRKWRRRCSWCGLWLCWISATLTCTNKCRHHHHPNQHQHDIATGMDHRQSVSGASEQSRQRAPCAYDLNVIFCHANTPTSISTSASRPAPIPNAACRRMCAAAMFKFCTAISVEAYCSVFARLYACIASPITSHNIPQNTTTIATTRLFFFMRADYHSALLLWDACQGCGVRFGHLFG